MWEIITAFLFGLVLRPFFDAILKAAKSVYTNAKKRHDDEQ